MDVIGPEAVGQSRTQGLTLVTLLQRSDTGLVVGGKIQDRKDRITKIPGRGVYEMNGVGVKIHLFEEAHIHVAAEDQRVEADGGVNVQTADQIIGVLSEGYQFALLAVGNEGGIVAQNYRRWQRHLWALGIHAIT